MRDKKVLILSAGNSICDIAGDVAKVAESAVISARRGYHFISKHMLGKPTDVSSDKVTHLPIYLAQKVFGGLLKVVNGDVSRYGPPKPDH